MTKQIAFLRGINVGGRRKLLMADLKALCTKLGLNNVSTYIQSGNILFESDLTSTEIAEKLKLAIAEKYDYDVPTLVIPALELIQIKNKNPYLNESDSTRLYYTFLKEIPDTILIENIKSISVQPDAYSIVHRTAYINCVKGYSITKLKNDFFEKKLKVEATTRNAKTINKLIELSS